MQWLWAQHSQDRAMQAGFNNPIYLGINSMLSAAATWQTVSHLLVDIGFLFDKINVATAAHRLAKLSRRREVRPLPLLLIWPRQLCRKSALAIAFTKLVVVQGDMV